MELWRDAHIIILKFLIAIKIGLTTEVNGHKMGQIDKLCSPPVWCTGTGTG